MAKRKRKPRQFHRAMAESTETLAPLFDEFDYRVSPDDFTLYVLASLIDEGKASFENAEFRRLVEEGLHRHVDEQVLTRARLVERVRLAWPGLDEPARKLARQVVGALEDASFPLRDVGVVVRTYLNYLIRRIEEAPDAIAGEQEARRLTERWRQGELLREQLVPELKKAGAGATAPMADLLLESTEDRMAAELAIDVLAAIGSRVAARILAHAISEPLLEEDLEERAVRAVRELWPMPRDFVLYALRTHDHEDLPIRWFQLLLATREMHLVDLVLDEVRRHADSPSSREELTVVLDLLNDCEDPGTEGKILRALTDPDNSDESLDLLRQWAEGSRFAETVQEGLRRWDAGEPLFIGRSDDLTTLAAARPGLAVEQLKAQWDLAYHETLGWQQRAKAGVGPVEKSLVKLLNDEMISRFAPDPALDEAELRYQIDAFRDRWLLTPQNGKVPLIEIFRERPRNNPWLRQLHLNELNEWYIKAAQLFDEGRKDAAARILDVILQIEPGYPFAELLRALA